MSSSATQQEKDQRSSNAAVHDKSPPLQQALVLLDAPHMKRVQTAHRLPGTYIGVRRIRPSSRAVALAAVSRKKYTLIEPLPHMTFKVADPMTGVERRMTKAEKRAAKQERQRVIKERMQQAKAAQQAEKEQIIKQDTQVDNEQQHPPQDGEDEDEKLEPSLEARVAEAAAAGANHASGEHHNDKTHEAAAIDNDDDDDKYYYFKITEASLEQELADLRGERSQVPPILLSPGQAHVAAAYNLVPPNTATTTSVDTTAIGIRNIPINDEYAQQWAAALRASMMPANETRKAEDLRSMVYDIVPQVWKRLRPCFSINDDLEPSESWDASCLEETSRMTLPCTLRPPLEIDNDWNLLMQALYRGNEIHMGCGAKFGCDILLYDGPRSKRHAFAGLRLVQSNPGDKFPLPRAYDLAGYVRCLNTAGKLALLATVIHDDEKEPYVSIIDLALEKVDVKRKPKRAKTLEERLETLAKTKS